MTMQAEFTEYLTRLLGRSVGADDTLTLTSGQQARVAGWLAEHGFAPPQLRAQLGARFAPARLLGDRGAPVAPDRAPPGQRRSEETSAAQRVGIDIQRVEEVIPAEALSDLKSSAEVTAMFSLREISYAQSRPSPGDTLCGLFCAKEALRKCDAALLAAPLTEIEILPDEDGKPRFPGFSLSVSHSGGFAVAVALADAHLGSPSTPPAPSVQTAAVPETPAALHRDTVTDEQANFPAHSGLRVQQPPPPDRGAHDAPRRGVGARAGALFEDLLRRLDLHRARWRRSKAMR